MATYPHLFLPLKVGSHFLKNRIVMAPVETGLEKQDYFDPRVVEFYEERARGDRAGALHPRQRRRARNWSAESQGPRPDGPACSTMRFA